MKIFIKNGKRCAHFYQEADPHGENLGMIEHGKAPARSRLAQFTVVGIPDIPDAVPHLVHHLLFLHCMRYPKSKALLALKVDPIWWPRS